MTFLSSKGQHLPDEAIVKWNDKGPFPRKFREFMGSINFVNNGISSTDFRTFYSDAVNLVRLVDIHEISRDDIKRRLLLDAAKAMAQKGHKDIADFRYELAAIVREELSKPSDTYFVLLPLGIHPYFSITPHSMTSLGIQIFFS